MVPDDEYYLKKFPGVPWKPGALINFMACDFFWRNNLNLFQSFCGAFLGFRMTNFSLKCSPMYLRNQERSSTSPPGSFFGKTIWIFSKVFLRFSWCPWWRIWTLKCFPVYLGNQERSSTSLSGSFFRKMTRIFPKVVMWYFWGPWRWILTSKCSPVYLENQEGSSISSPGSFSGRNLFNIYFIECLWMAYIHLKISQIDGWLTDIVCKFWSRYLILS